MDKVERLFIKLLAVIYFTVFSAYTLDKIADTLHESNAMLLTETLNTPIGFIVSVHGYNELYIIGTSILLGFISALIAIELSKQKR